jgi:S1-C subfamily serine protease
MRITLATLLLAACVFARDGVYPLACQTERQVKTGNAVAVAERTLLTAAHVVASSPQPCALSISAQGKTYQARILYTSATQDIAVLVLLDKQAQLIYSPMAAGNPEVNQYVYTVSNPVGKKQWEDLGKIEAQIPEKHLWANTIPSAFPGVSGGGVFNNAGELVGITSGYVAVGETKHHTFTGIGSIREEWKTRMGFELSAFEEWRWGE